MPAVPSILFRSSFAPTVSTQVLLLLLSLLPTTAGKPPSFLGGVGLLTAEAPADSAAVAVCRSCCCCCCCCRLSTVVVPVFPLTNPGSLSARVDLALLYWVLLLISDT